MASDHQPQRVDNSAPATETKRSDTFDEVVVCVDPSGGGTDGRRHVICSIGSGHGRVYLISISTYVNWSITKAIKDHIDKLNINYKFLSVCIRDDVSVRLREELYPVHSIQSVQIKSGEVHHICNQLFYSLGRGEFIVDPTVIDGYNADDWFVCAAMGYRTIGNFNGLSVCREYVDKIGAYRRTGTGNAIHYAINHDALLSLINKFVVPSGSVELKDSSLVPKVDDSIAVISSALAALRSAGQLLANEKKKRLTEQVVPSTIPTRSRGYNGDVAFAFPEKCPIIGCESNEFRVIKVERTGPPTQVSRPDKRGEWHYHMDIGIPYVYYMCGHGHMGDVQGYYQCWCGWDVRVRGTKLLDPQHAPDLDWVDPDITPPPTNTGDSGAPVISMDIDA